MNTRITQLFKIEYPIIQGGMVWCSGWELAAAVSNSGGLGIIGSGSMYPEILREHIQKCKAATHKPFGVNVPLLYPDIDKQIEVIIDSSGNSRVETKGFAGSDCMEASRSIERALGTAGHATTTPEYFHATSTQKQANAQNGPASGTT